MADDQIAALAVGLNEDSKAKRARAKKSPEAAADAVASGAIDGAAAVAENGGDADQTVAGAIGGAAAAASTVTGDDQTSGVVDDVKPEAEPEPETDEPEDEASPIAEKTVDRIEAVVADAQFDTRTLVGDMLIALLDLYKTREKPWWQMTEADQRIVSTALKHAVDEFVTNAIALMSSHGNGEFFAKLDSYSNKGAFKITLTAEATRDTSDALFVSEGQTVMVRRYDPKPFQGVRSEPDIKPDQEDLQFESDAGTKALPEPTPDHPDDDSDLAGDLENDSDQKPDPFDDDNDNDQPSADD